MTTPPAASPPANWYPDPQTPGQLRYWDGQQWTQHVHPAQQPAPPAATQPATGGTLTPGGPGAVQPGAVQPGAVQPGAVQPGAVQPGAVQPGAVQPGAVQPGAVQPGAVQPGAVQPGAVQPGAVQPGAVQPGAVQPGAVQPGAVQPGAVQPGAVQPGAVQPGVRPRAHADPTPPTPKDIDQDTGRGPIGDSPSSAVHWLVPTGRSPQARLAGGIGFLSLLLAGVAVSGVLEVYGAYLAAGIAMMAVVFGVIGVQKASQGFHGGGRSWFGVAAGFIAIGVATYEYLYPEALLNLVV